MKSTVAVVALGFVVTTAAPAVAAPGGQRMAPGSDIGGFSTTATATPLRIEVYEPAIPIPSSPQFELNFSYSKVDASTGPASTARASAMWPGDSVGEGLKTFGEQLGLPAALTDGGYPMQVNAATPGDTPAQAQEPLPGMVMRVATNDKRAVAKAGYSTSGSVAEGGTTAKPADPLAALQDGDLSALTSILTGAAAPTADTGSSPLGLLSLLVDAGGMSSVSSTDYVGDKVVATATTHLGNLSLVAGLVKLTGVDVVAQTRSTLAGAKSTSKVTFGSLSIAGTPFEFDSDGIVAGGTRSPIPGLPADPGKALAALGITFSLPAPQRIMDGSHGGMAVNALQITMDTGPLRSKLPALPLGDLINKLPDLPGQASLLKGLLLALTEAAPKLVVLVGAARTDAQTVPAVNLSGSTPPPTDTTGSPTTGTTTGGTAGTSGTPGTSGIPADSSASAAGAAPVATTNLTNTSGIPGLPPLGSIPMLLLLAGLLLASGAGWYVRRAGGLLFGGPGACAHGLKAGVPDLRKV